MTDIVERLRDYASDDHERLCQGREYTCSCGYDDKRDPLITEAADLITALRAENEKLWAALHRIGLGSQNSMTSKEALDMIDRFAVNSVLDVGSGRGHAAHWFHRHNCCTIAIDAEERNVASALHPTVMHDIMAAPFVCPVDLAHCQEVVEHIPPQHLDNLMRTLCNGDTVIMSHGEPGQAGHSHVNCQPQEYWVNAMLERGFLLLEDDTIRIRKLAAGEAAHHLARSGLVFGRRMARQA